LIPFPLDPKKGIVVAKSRNEKRNSNEFLLVGGMRIRLNQKDGQRMIVMDLEGISMNQTVGPIKCIK
jgi:hypothetical protein